MGYIADILIASVLGAALFFGAGSATATSNSAVSADSSADLGGTAPIGK